MKEIDISKYITRLEAKQEEMLSVLHKRTSFINLSEPPAREYKSDDDSNIQSNKRNRSSKSSKSSNNGCLDLTGCFGCFSIFGIPSGGFIALVIIETIIKWFILIVFYDYTLKSLIKITYNFTLSAFKFVLKWGSIAIGVVFCGLILFWLIHTIFEFVSKLCHTDKKDETPTDSADKQLVEAEAEKDDAPRDYNILSEHVNRSLSRLNSYLSDSWNTFVSSANGELKDAIMQLDVDAEEKDRLLKEVINTTVLNFQMTTLDEKLKQAVSAGNTDAFRSVITDFEKEYMKTIASARRQQIKYWMSVNMIF